jgi:hypothetical protein
MEKLEQEKREQPKLENYRNAIQQALLSTMQAIAQNDRIDLDFG